MRKRNFSQRIFIFPLAIVLLVFSFKDHVYSKSESNHDDRGYESIAIDTSTDRIFAVKDEKGIDVIDIKTGDITNTITLNKEIETIVIDEQRRILVAAEEKAFQIISLDTFETRANIKTREEAKATGMDSELGMLLIADEEDKLTAIDLNTYQKIKEIKIPEKPVSIAIDPQLHIAVIVHNTWGEGNKEGESDKTGQRGEEGEEDNYSKNRDNITIIALNTLSIIKTLQTGKNPTAVAINTLTHEAAITNGKNNDLTIIDLNALSIKGTIPVGKHPAALSYNECLNTLSVIGGEDKAWLEVIDMNTWTKTASCTFNENNPPSPPFSKGGMVASGDSLRRGGFSDKFKDIKVHSYLNKAVIAGEHGLNIINLPNPLPQLISLTPEKALRGEKTITLTLTGKGLLRTTETYINGNRAISTFIQCGAIEVQVPEEYLNATGDIEIKAKNPTPEGGTSNPINLQINNPVPSISMIDPIETKTNVNNLTLTIYGSGFFDDTEIYLGNIKKPITYISPTKFQLNLTHEDLKTAGQYEITAKNLSPGGGTSNKAIFTIKPSLEIKITSPQDGETINKAKTIVKGTFKSDTKDVGITVNGILADVIPEDSNRGTSNQWIANGVPLTIGANTITATIKDKEGNTETASITINTNDATQYVTLSANITSGIPPLTTYFSLSTNIPNPIATYQMDFEGDGIVDYTGITFENITHTYTSEGIFYPTLTVTDNQGNTYSDTIAITVMNKAEIDTLLKGKWEGMKGVLEQGNIESALNYFSDDSKEKYRKVFLMLKNYLPAIVATMQNIKMDYLQGSIAEYRISRIEDINGQLKEITYFIYFIKDAEGLWKIESL